MANNPKKIFIETYGCQMNVADSDIVRSILSDQGYTSTHEETKADVILINTCSVRENAEQKVRNRLQHIKHLKKSNPGLLIGILGCMAGRLKSKLLEEEKLVDLVVGPDAYRDLPDLIKNSGQGHQAVNTLLSLEETYADISPVRSCDGISAYITITRGCDNMCAFCIVPFTRGRERSRDPKSILSEAKCLFGNNCKEITLLGQNVDSYLWFGGGPKKNYLKNPSSKQHALNFAELLEMVAEISPLLRVRFSTSHPKDLSEEVLRVMNKHSNICKHIHLPLQSGNNLILQKMNRGYTREWYLNKISSIQSILPECAISTDIITGFCSETEAQHRDTLELMEKVKFHFAYMFKYSVRPGTPAHRKMKDDVPEETKNRRLSEIIALQQKHAVYRNRAAINKEFEILVEGASKRSGHYFFGRNSQNTVIVFPKEDARIGDYVNVKVHACTSATLKGSIIKK